MKKRTILLVVSCLIVAALLLASCGSAVTEEEGGTSPTQEEVVVQEPSATETPEPAIPAHYITYNDNVGLLSISYPPDWVPATSIMDELFEQVKEEMESTDPEARLKGATLLFLGGIPFEEGYYPTVNIGVIPRSAGYWTLDEIFEKETQYVKEHAERYREYSQVKTLVDKREAVIIDFEYYDPDAWRYIQLFMIEGKFLWLVTCGVESKDFKEYEDTFNSIIRSIRIFR